MCHPLNLAQNILGVSSTTTTNALDPMQTLTMLAHASNLFAWHIYLVISAISRSSAWLVLPSSLTDPACDVLPRRVETPACAC